MRSVILWALDWPGKHKELLDRLAEEAGFLIGTFCRYTLILVLLCGLFATMTALIILFGYLFGIDLMG